MGTPTIGAFGKAQPSLPRFDLPAMQAIRGRKVLTIADAVSLVRHGSAYYADTGTPTNAQSPTGQRWIDGTVWGGPVVWAGNRGGLHSLDSRQIEVIDYA